jgi:hypothetical protein
MSARTFTFLMPEAPVPAMPTQDAGWADLQLPRAAAPQPLVIHAPAAAPPCVAPRIFEIRATRSARHLPRVIYGMKGACTDVARVAVVMPAHSGPRVVHLAD